MSTTHRSMNPDATTADLPSVGFAVELSPQVGATVVRVAGELDAATGPELAAALERAADAGEVRLDLSDTSFIDSAGIRVLVRSMWSLREAGSSLRLVSASDPAATILRITGILDVLKEPAP